MVGSAWLGLIWLDWTFLVWARLGSARLGAVRFGSILVVLGWLSSTAWRARNIGVRGMRTGAYFGVKGSERFSHIF